MTEQLVGVAVALGGGMLSAASFTLARLQTHFPPPHPLVTAFPIDPDDGELAQLLSPLD